MSFSANVIAQTQTLPDSCVVLPVEVARKVAVDLVKGDETRELLDSMKVSLNLHKDLIKSQDSTINVLEQVNIAQTKVISGYELQVEQSKRLQEQLKTKADKNKAYAIGFGCSTLVAILALIFGGR